MTQYRWLKSKTSELTGFWFVDGRTRVEDRRVGRARRSPNLELVRLESRLAMSAELTGGLESIYADPSTGQSYEIHALPPVAGDATATTLSEGSTPSTQFYPLSNIPVLNSFPGAKATIYLDFDGDYESSWGSYSQIATPAYDTDGDPTTFSAAELTAIRNIWSYVAEDYSPFNVNVTTVSPSSLENGVALKVVIGGTGSWLGQVYGGISYVGSFSNAMPNISYVFPKNLANGNSRYTADAVSHEAGHAFGLSHQSRYSGATLTQEYSTVNVNGATPLMGSSYSAARGTWWFGTSGDGATIYQDDMAVIASATNGFGYRAESAGTTAATATFLYNASNQISASGVIVTGSDVNYYAFLASAGPATFTVQAAAAGFNNLVPTIQLYDSTGTIMLASASASQNGSTATIATTLPDSGSYRLVIRGDGSYGNAGQYTVNGSIAVPSSSLFVDVPSRVSAEAVSSSRIDVSWFSSGGNESGYLLERSVNGGAWGTFANLPAGMFFYSDTSVTAGSTYSYRLIAYNPFMSSKPSSSAFATTPVVVTGPPAAVTELYVSSRASNAVTLTWGRGSGPTSGFQISRSLNNGKAWSVIAVVSGDKTSFTDRLVKAGKRYTYRVVAFTEQGSAAPSATISVVTPKTGTTQAARQFQSIGRFAKQAATIARSTPLPNAPASLAAVSPLDFTSPLPAYTTSKAVRVNWKPVIV